MRADGPRARARFGLALALLAAMGATAPSAAAHDGATGVIKQRMDAMKALGGDAKRIKQALAATPYDPATAVAAARRIEAQAGAALTRGYPEGSGHAPSEAKPEIWSDWAGFQARASALAERAGALASAAPNRDEATAAFQDLIKACAACHSAYRAK